MQTLLAPKAVTATNTTAEPPRGASHAEAPEPTEDPASTPLRLSFNENEGKAMDLTKLCKRTRDSSDEDDLAPRKNTATCSTEFSESSEEKSHTSQGSKETGSESTAIVDTNEASTAAESPLAVPADATHLEHSDNEEIVYDCSNEDSCAPHPAVVPPEDPSAPATPCPLSSSIGEPTEAAMTPKVSRSSPSAPTATGTNDPSHNLLPRRQCRHGGGTEMPTKAPEKDSAKKVAPLTAAVFLHTPIAGAPPATR